MNMLIKKIVPKNVRDRFVTGCIIFIITILAMLAQPLITSCGIIILTWFMVYEVISMHQYKNLLFYSLVAWYPILPASIMLFMHQSNVYRNLFWYTIIATFCFDTASYIFGKIYTHLYTSTKIAPSISPQKSWQGACGGYLATTYFIFSNILPTVWYRLLFSSFIFCACALAGDLFESYIKRNAGVKDSGNFLPGHGGILDRFDAILATMTLTFFYKDYLIGIIR
jgi:phosphatidate cytidylyltransferase